ncbi:MAG: restriction endonuclease subunit S [Proteobacteria bacterium]|nr:restriction endonuclease subunit S [Pseudomonadota bacterium]
MKYGLTEKQLAEIIARISDCPEIEEAVLFGSRAMGNYKEASDVDIAIKGETVTAALAGKLKSDIEEDTYLPFFFDFVAYATIANEDLKEHIDTKGVLVYRRGWRECKLGEIYSFASGLSKSRKEFGFGYNFLSFKEVFHNYFVPDKLIELANTTGTERSRCSIKRGDVFLTRTSETQEELGMSCVALKDYPDATFNGFTKRLRPKNPKKVIPEFAGFYFRSPRFRAEVTSMASITTRASLNNGMLSDLTIVLPPLTEQKAIASVLSSLDDKIDLLHRQNKTLEAMAETLFRQWFVEEAKEDWKDDFLGDIADINPTYQLKKGEIAPYLEMSNVSSSTFNPVGWTMRNFSSGMKFQNGDTLLARITPCLENGKTCFVTFLDQYKTGWGSTEYIVIRMKQPFHPFVSYIIAKDKDFREYAISTMSGSSGRQRAQADVIKEYEIKLPPIPIIEKLNGHLAGIIQKLKRNSNQIRTLEKLRDTLLPKLMSGEVRVKYKN